MRAENGGLPPAMGRLDDDGFLEDVDGVDTPDWLTTTESLAIGASLESATGFAGDCDWYRVTLTAGVHYRFTLTGSGGARVYVRTFKGQIQLRGR